MTIYKGIWCPLIACRCACSKEPTLERERKIERMREVGEQERERMRGSRRGRERQSKREKWEHIFKKIDLFIMDTAFCLHVSCRAQRHKTHHGWLWSTMCLLRIELRTSGTPDRSLKLWAISSAKEDLFTKKKQNHTEVKICQHVAKMGSSLQAKNIYLKKKNILKLNFASI